MTTITRALDYIAFCKFLESLENAHAFLMRAGAKLVASNDETVEQAYQLGEFTVSFDGKNWF